MSDPKTTEAPDAALRTPRFVQTAPIPDALMIGVRREIFALEEGDVTLIFPENLSAESYEDLEEHVRLFLKKAKRRADARERAPNEKISAPPAGEGS